MFCLFYFVKEVAQALDKYHKLGFSHQDIRLENVCFNGQYQPVLIDLDRSIHNTASAITYGNSCMYVAKRSPTQIDFIQLGWLVT